MSPQVFGLLFLAGLAVQDFVKADFKRLLIIRSVNLNYLTK